MKYLTSIIIAFTFLACKEKPNDNCKLLYHEVETFTRHSNYDLTTQKLIYREEIADNPTELRKFDSLNNIDLTIENSLKKVDFSNRKRTIFLRDSIMKKLNIPIKFRTEDELKNIDYSMEKTVKLTT
jgi:hypothetical protein